MKQFYLQPLFYFPTLGKNKHSSSLEKKEFWINVEISTKKNQLIFPDFTVSKKFNLDNYNLRYSIH